jgi:mono/diheme cytochrome c family protein
MSAEAIRRSIILVVLAAFVAAGMVGTSGCSPDDPDPAPPPPPVTAPAPEDAPVNGIDAPTDGDSARVLVESRCSGCHTLDRVWAQDQDRAGWESTVRRMESNGLQITDEEREIIVEYLASQ